MTSWQDSIQTAISSLFPINTDPSGDVSAEVLIVDVGGGQGTVVRNFQAHRPDLKGRMVSQNVLAVIQGLGNIEGVEGMAYDFFTSQPVKD